VSFIEVQLVRLFVGLLIEVVFVLVVPVGGVAVLLFGRIMLCFLQYFWV
jgi:hypothetical protein